MQRRQLFEFCDQPWLKGVMREAFLDCLSFIHHLYQPYYHLARPVAAWADAGKPEGALVLDLASGSGEQIALLLDTGRKRHIRLPSFMLSDLYPDSSAWRQLQQKFGDGGIRYTERSLSALDIPPGMPRYWSIFTAFHHLPPEAAKQLLQQLVTKGDSLCIIEFTQRRWLDIASMFFALPAHLIAPFFAKKFKWRKLLFTSIIPIIPFMVSFDGIVSALRAYTKDEITAMLPAESRDDFESKYYKVWWRFCPLKATMLTLLRKQSV